MPLLEQDEKYLTDKGFTYEVHEDSKLGALLTIKNYQLPQQYQPRTADMLLIIPNNYPMAPMDMFWVFPEVRFVNGNRRPNNADQFENYLGISWQRFSRHYQWRPGTSSLISHLMTIQRELAKEI